VVARDHHHRRVRGQRCGEGREDARSCGERVPDRALPKLDQVSEQEQAIDAGERLAQRRQTLVVAGLVRTRPEVQVGYD